MKVYITQARKPKGREEAEKILGKEKAKMSNDLESRGGESIGKEVAINSKEKRGCQ